MKKLSLYLFLFGIWNTSYANSLDDWSDEDLCRWVDAVSIPDPILLEIDIREIVCFSRTESIEVSIQEPYISEHGTVFPSPSSSSSSNNNQRSGIKFIFNYKVTL